MFLLCDMKNESMLTENLIFASKEKNNTRVYQRKTNTFEVWKWRGWLSQTVTWFVKVSKERRQAEMCWRVVDTNLSLELVPVEMNNTQPWTMKPAKPDNKRIQMSATWHLDWWPGRVQLFNLQPVWRVFGCPSDQMILRVSFRQHSPSSFHFSILLQFQWKSVPPWWFSEFRDVPPSPLQLCVIVRVNRFNMSTLPAYN